MPIHDWTRVTAGTWHDMHVGWIAELRTVLNGGLLPEGYYAQAEQIAGPRGPDVLTLQEPDIEPVGEGGLAVALAPPKVSLQMEAEVRHGVRTRRTIAIRHTSDDRIIALLELVSPGNKSNRHGIRAVVNKALDCLERGYHLLIVDLFPPTPRDPQGLHSLIWEEYTGQEFEPPADKPLTLVAYAAGSVPKAYVEPTAVGLPLIDMPLFLTAERYVNVPLEATYTAAYRGVPAKYKRELEG